MPHPAKFPSWRLNPTPAVVISISLIGLGVAAAAVAIYFLRIRPPGAGVAGTILIAILGACLFAAGASLFVPAIGALRQHWVLKRKGQKCIGRVTNIQSRYVPRVGPEAYLTFEFRVPGSNRLYHGVSRSLSIRQIKQWQAGDEIEVCYDPNDPDYALPQITPPRERQRDWRARPLDVQQTLVLRSVTANYAGACIALGVVMARCSGQASLSSGSSPLISINASSARESRPRVPLLIWRARRGETPPVM
jgi:hypothetical protein